MKVEVHNQTVYETIHFENLLNVVFDGIKNDKSVQVIFVDETEIQRLNYFFRQMDKPTDVLSFASDEDDSLGDIFICLSKAEKQAKILSHSFEREVAFLAVHGYLHLNGFTHDTLEEEKAMIKKQNEILAKANIER